MLQSYRLRLERIERLKRGQKELPDARGALQSEADAPVIAPEVLQKPVKRQRVERAAQDSESDAEGSESEDDAELDWRAKGL